jgi:gamma-glutamyltranspeptidase/glutathione hydrolase
MSELMPEPAAKQSAPMRLRVIILTTSRHRKALLVKLHNILIASALLFLAPGWCPAAATAPQAAIASAHPLATRAGMEILAAGGNAFDAAVAVSAALAVVEPTGSGLGGGGFWLLHRASDGHEVMIDGRERAPLAAHRDMYLDNSGEVIPRLSVDGPLAAAIPGEPAALVHLARRYGRLPLAKSLAPAIRLARDGFPVDEHYRRAAKFRLEILRASPAAAAVFLQDNDVPALGYVIKQPDLAMTLTGLADQGRDGFYAGTVAERLVAGVHAVGGIWTKKDLAAYSVLERTPVSGDYRGLHITSAPPPSSGGVVLLTMLNILSGYDLSKLDAATRTHVIVEAMRRAYRDRADYLGDPDFVTMPIAQLTSPLYAAGLRAGIRLDKATPSSALPGAAAHPQGVDTTHFSILDKDGNRVAATLSVNYPFGSGFMPPGTGVVLNDEMDDFSAKPGTPNVYGLVGGEANAIAPGKRPLSSMTPTFLEDDKKVVILGTPGGSRIITMVLLATLDIAAGGDADSAVSVKRFHHQFLPDVIQYEPGALTPTVVTALQAQGHQLKELGHSYGNMQLVWWDKRRQRAAAASDPRGNGLALTH